MIAHIRGLYVPHDMKATRVVPVGFDAPESCWLATAPAFGEPEILGRHTAGGEFDAPISLRAGTPLLAYVFAPTSSQAGTVWLDEVRDDAWCARVERERRHAVAVAQVEALDAAIWWSGVPV